MEINEGLKQIDRVTQQNTANAEQSAAASEELAGNANELNNLLKRFKFNSSTILQQAIQSQESQSEHVRLPHGPVQ